MHSKGKNTVMLTACRYVGLNHSVSGKNKHSMFLLAVCIICFSFFSTAKNLTFLESFAYLPYLT